MKRKAHRNGTPSTYFECLFGGQDLPKKFASADTEGVSEDAHFLDVLHGAQSADMGFQILRSVEL